MSAVRRSGLFGGTALEYEARVDEIIVDDRSGRPGARYVFTDYRRLPDGGGAERPVLFAFNGGPGSASLWLHLGLLGPRRVADADALRPRTAPPFDLMDNPDCPLDVADVVFVDPPGTGFSRVLSDEQEADFLGVLPDAIATVQFISAWSRANGREQAPKILIGESYGAIRAAVVANISTGGPSRTGRLETIAVNAVIILGSALLRTHQINDLTYALSLPSLAATAWYHRCVSPRPADLGEHVQAATQFANGEYLTALFAGTRLTTQRRDTIAKRLHELIGIAPKLCLDHDLRLDPVEFSTLLLADTGKQVGMYDSRYTLPLAGRGPDPVADDPAMGQYAPSFAGSITRYLREELGVDRPEDYRAIEFAGVNGRWDHGNGSGATAAAINYAESLATMMRRNHQFELMACAGLYDLIAPVGALDYALSHAPMDRDRVHVRVYEAGHMPYLGSDSRAHLAKDLREFIARVHRT